MFPESFRELLDSPGVAVITTIEPDGSPQSSAVWYLLDGGKIKLSLNGRRRKVQNLKRNPAVSLLFLDPANPQRTLEVRGRAAVALDPDFSFRELVSAKYSSDASVHDGPNDRRYVVTIEPTRVREWPPPA